MKDTLNNRIKLLYHIFKTGHKWANSHIIPSSMNSKELYDLADKGINMPVFIDTYFEHGIECMDCKFGSQ